MKFFVHLVLDEFGAEVAGKVHRELLSVASAADERHIYVWCGGGSAPAEPDYWSERYPPWDDAVEWPAEAASPQAAEWDLDRGAAAAAIAGWQGLREKLHRWIEQRPRELLGAHVPLQAAVVLTGSLAPPVSGAILLGLLTAFARARRRGGMLAVPVHVVLGIGPASGQSTANDEKTYALIARNLLDLAGFFQSHPPHEAAAPVYLVGEAPLDGGAPGQAEQVATAAFTILGLSRSAAAALNRPPASIDPFAFQVDGDQKVHWAERSYDPAHPFAVAGAYAVSCPAEPLARVLAARVAALCMELLAQQNGCVSLENAGKLQLGDSLGGFLADVEGRAAAALWDQVAEKTKIPWPQETAARQPQWYDLDRLRLLFGRLFDQKDGQQVLAWYGEPRMLALPMDDWPGALDEMVAVIEQGVLTRRRQQLTIMKRRVLTAFLDAIEHGVGEVFGRTFQEPVEATPHLAAQALLGRIRNHLEASRDHLEEIEIRKRPQLADRAELQEHAGEARQRFEKELAAVPSPAAVILRLAPLFAACLGMLLALPFDLGPLNPAPLRLAAGALIGASAAVYFYMRHLDGARRRIWHMVRVWMEQYKALLDFDDEMARTAAYRDLLASLKDCLEWFFNGETESPPIPTPLRPPLKREAASAAADPDLLKPQTVLAHFRQYLRDAAASFRAAETKFLADFQVCRRETILPEISVPDPGGIDRELARINESGHIPPDWMPQLYRGNTGAAIGNWVLPFAAGGAGVRDHLWRASFSLPTPRDLLDEKTRLGSSGFRFFDTLRAYMRVYFSEGFALSTRLSEYLRNFPGRVIASTPLCDRYSSLAAPSAVVSCSQISIVVLAANAEDPLAAGLNWSNDAGADHLSLHLQVRNCVSAADLIGYPNEAAPTQAMGLAWKAYLEAPWEGHAFLPANLPKEIG
jgi:hypothetical protein